MNNRFKLNEEEKNRIRGLHNINEDAGMDTPGGNPGYFYDDDSLFGKSKKESGGNYTKDAEEGATYTKEVEGDTAEMPKEDIVNELIGIYSYSQDGATDLVNTALETLITNLGGFKDDINEQNYPDTTSKVPITTQIEEMGKEESLEKLLGEAQRLTRFVENRRMGKDNWSNEDLVNIQENINKEITNYLK